IVAFNRFPLRGLSPLAISIVFDFSSSRLRISKWRSRSFSAQATCLGVPINLGREVSSFASSHAILRQKEKIFLLSWRLISQALFIILCKLNFFMFITFTTFFRQFLSLSYAYIIYPLGIFVN